jgi:hypothetical protein
VENDPSPADKHREMWKRRIEDRKMCIDTIEVHWYDPEGNPQRSNAILVNVSVSGARLQLQAPVPQDVEIHWYRARLQLSFWGRVRYCVPQKNGYSVGVELDPVCKESENRIMRHENLSPGKKIQVRIQPVDPWSDWTVVSTTRQIVTLRAQTTEFIGYRQPDGSLEDARGRRIELRQAEAK